MGPNRLMSYNPQGIHILKLIIMAKVKIDVENSELKTLKVALTYSTKVLTTPNHLDDFNMMR
jgi:hypothetical protein